MKAKDANQLRIGNWIYDKQVGIRSEFKVTAGDILDIEAGDENEYCFEQLIEYWLVKFNYKYNKKEEYWESPNGFKLWNSGTKLKPEFYHINSELLIHLNYVHHLQNLEFDLTGEELTIKTQIT